MVSLDVNALPKLPGYSFVDPRIPPKMIPQTLAYKNGTIRVAGLPEQAHPARPRTERMEVDAEIEAEVRPMTQRTAGFTATTKAKRDVAVDPQNKPPPPPGAPAVAALGDMHLGDGSSIPAWVAYDAQQLAYAAYFVEPSVDGRERVRSCAIRFYLEDGTVDVCEPRVDNSGLDQGKLLKRHRAVASDGRDLTFHHLRVGEPVVIYGREYNVTACDDFTREFLAREGVVLAPNTEIPDVLIDEGPSVLGTIGMGLRGVGGKRVFEDANASPLGVVVAGAAAETKNGPKKDRFDRRVLRFFCAWDDRANEGGALVRYTLNYYLSDGTIEVLESTGIHNRGRDPFPKMLARSMLPSGGGFAVGPPGGGANGAGGYVTVDDLRVGGVVGVYGRDLTVYDVDEFTRGYFVKEKGRTLAEMAPRAVDDGARARKVAPVPPHDGIGSEEDSLRNCVSLVPRRPPKDVINFEKNDGRTLTFTAAHPPGPGTLSVDVDRRFVITYYLVDGTVSVYEPPMKNSGHVGGKFLERTFEPVKKPGSKTTAYGARDFYVGNTLVINSFAFTLLATDAATEKELKALGLA